MEGCSRELLTDVKMDRCKGGWREFPVAANQLCRHTRAHTHTLSIHILLRNIPTCVCLGWGYTLLLNAHPLENTAR